MKNKLILFLFPLFILSPIFSQDEEEIKDVIAEDNTPSKLYYGLDFGVYFANSSYSQFLNGAHPNGVSRVLTNTYTNQAINDKLVYPIESWEYSENTSYDMAVSGGGFAGLKLKEEMSVVLKFNFTILKMNAPVVLKLKDPSSFTGNYVETTVTSQEQRFNVGLGIEKVFEIDSKFKPFASLGLSLNYIQLEKHNYNVKGLNYNIMRVLRYEGIPSNLQTYYKKIDGFGYGIFGEIGGKYKLTKKFSGAIGVTILYQNNKSFVEKLGIGTNYKPVLLEEAYGLKLSSVVFARLIWN